MNEHQQQQQQQRRLKYSYLGLEACQELEVLRFGEYSGSISDGRGVHHLITQHTHT